MDNQDEAIIAFSFLMSNVCYTLVISTFWTSSLQTEIVSLSLHKRNLFQQNFGMTLFMTARFSVYYKMKLQWFSPHGLYRFGLPVQGSKIAVVGLIVARTSFRHLRAWQVTFRCSCDLNFKSPLRVRHKLFWKAVQINKSFFPIFILLM